MIPPWSRKYRVSRGAIEYRFTVVTTVPDETFTPPFEITGTYDCNINWGDGSNSDITVWNHADTIHPYATPGTHEIAITGTIIGWSFNNAGDCALYYETKSWGPFNPGNSGGAFYGCVNHTCTATDVLDLTGVTTLENDFRGNTALTEIPSAPSWDFTNIVNATNCYEGVTLTVANYNAIITSYSAQAASGAYAFHGGNSKYTTGGAVLAARNAWVAKGWTITDGGENVGSELVPALDGDFSGGQGNWAVISGNDVTWDNVSMNWAANESNNIRLPMTLTNGTLYRFEFEIIAYTSGDIFYLVGDTQVEPYVTEAVATFVGYAIAGASDWINFWSTDFIGKLDNVSLKEVF